MRDLIYIRWYYQLEERHGVRILIGGRLKRHDTGVEGVIEDTAGQYIAVRWDGASETEPVYPGDDNLAYETSRGWITVSPPPNQPATALVIPREYMD
ncbi:hypothetical protein ACWDZ4_20260 [Streptomyces sp. NPDC003016]